MGSAKIWHVAAYTAAVLVGMRFSGLLTGIIGKMGVK